MNDILLSIDVITYNHKNFLKQCLDGILMQKTNFKFEVLVYDDASTDGTVDIIRKYEKNYPNIIKPIYQTENQYSKGISISRTFQFPRIKGKYVALCEGDDYWTDPYKLQKQVDFLDNHPDYSIVFHPVKVFWENGEHHSGYWGPNEKEFKNLDDAIWHNNIIPTLSVMYRWRLYGDKISLYPQGIAPADWYLHLLHAQIGKIGFIPDIMGVYRKHSGGIWYNDNKTEDFFIRYFWPRIFFYENAKSQFKKDFTDLEVDLIYNLLRLCVKKHNYKILSTLINKNKKMWEKLYLNVKGYLSKYPTRNSFLSWLCYKLSFGEKHTKYKEYHRMNFIKKRIEKINIQDIL